MKMSKGELFLTLLMSLKEKYPNVLKDVRGRGMMIGIEFITNELGVMFSKMMFLSNILVAGTLANAQTIRIEPPLTITCDEILYAYDVCETVIKTISSSISSSSLISTSSQPIRSKL